MAGDEQIIIRRYQPADEAAIEEITYRTGFKGEDLTGRGFFADSRLWFLIFIGYYCRYEPEHFFVAVDTESERAIGFICGTSDTERQEARFLKKSVPRIALRGFFFTLWRYPRSFLALLEMGWGYWREGRREGMDKQGEITREYPAHLHINLLESYQGKGIGSRLIRHFEDHLRALEVKGVHLHTTSLNRKAVPFYRKMGFVLLEDSGPVDSPHEDELRYLTFGKRLI